MAFPRLIFVLRLVYLFSRKETVCAKVETLNTESRFREFVKYENYFLDENQVGSALVNLPTECALGCVGHSACVSFNIEAEKTLVKESRLLCELLSGSMLGNLEKFRRTSEFHHYEVYVSPHFCKSIR